MSAKSSVYVRLGYMQDTSKIQRVPIGHERREKREKFDTWMIFDHRSA